MFGFWRSLCSVTQSCPILCDPMDCSPRLLWSLGYPGKNTGVGCCYLLQRIFLTWDRICGSCIGRQILYHWAMWEALGAVYSSLNNNTVSHLPLLVPVFNEDCLNLLMKHNTAGQVEGTYCHFCDSKQLEHHDKVLLPSSQEAAVGRLEGTS